MHKGSFAFVAVVFGALAASFLYTTYQLWAEFGPGLAVDVATFYSHLFVFFPTLGLVVLAGFYIPACIFTDMYWRHLDYGKIRYVIGFAGVFFLALAASDLLTSSEERSLFEINPDLLRADVGEPPQCAATTAATRRSVGTQGVGTGGVATQDLGALSGPRLSGPALTPSSTALAPACARMPITVALANIRQVSAGRKGLRGLERTCRPDPYTERPSELSQRKFCFVRNALPGDRQRYVTAAACCDAQMSMAAHVNALYAQPDGASRTGVVHAQLLWPKVFFLLVVFSVAGLLVLQRRTLDKHYANWLPRMRRGIVIGGIAMVLWPLMNQAFSQSYSVLYGNTGASELGTMSPLISIAFLAWAVMIVYFFLRPEHHDLEQMKNLGSVVSAGIAFLTYREIVDYFHQWAGSGAGLISAIILGVFCAACFIVLLLPVPQRQPATSTSS